MAKYKVIKRLKDTIVLVGNGEDYFCCFSIDGVNFGRWCKHRFWIESKNLDVIARGVEKWSLLGFAMNDQSI